MKKIIAVILAVALFFAVAVVSAVVTLNSVSVSVSADGTVAQLEAFGNVWEKGIIEADFFESCF